MTSVFTHISEKDRKVSIFGHIETGYTSLSNSLRAISPR